MAITNIGDIKKLIAGYMGHDSASDLTPPIGIDIGLFALNTARRKVEKLTDFVYAEETGGLSIANNGGSITAVTGLGAGATVKRIKSVELPINGGYRPIEFLTEDAYTKRLRAQIGRSAYDANATPIDAGISDENPLAYQLGQTIFLAPSGQFTFPVAARVNVVKFMPDYASDGDTDFFTQWAPEYLQWQAILEVNKYFRRFGNKDTEVSIDEKEVRAFAEEEMQTLLAWNASMLLDTNTPPEG